jgi:polysaccharide chain length determinant protein (PEP-CTERM system associated)
MEERMMSVDEYKAILRRRKWSLILPALMVVTIAAVVALVLPPVYKSTATILIEEQEIPAEFVMASVTSYAEQRIQTINQRIMSSTRLLDIIKRFNLYSDLRDTQPTEVIIAKMRDDTDLEMINADVIDPRTGRPSEASIAFALSYQGKDNPQKIQQVATVLTSLFLEENLRKRVKQTQETADFLEGEMEKVKESLDALEARIADFKEQNINTLPELLQANTQNLSHTERSIEMLQEQLRSQKEREGYLQTQLASISPQEEDKQRLDQLRIQLVQLKSRFTDAYPDVIKTKAEIADLERQMATDKTNQAGLPDNPAYVTLASQLSSTQAEIDSIRAQIKTLTGKAQKYQRQIDNTPRVEEVYRKLLTERNNTQAKYDDMMRKVMEARVSQGLEKEQKGERFTLIDPARLPEKPFKPNRWAIALIGVVMGIGAGVGTAALREFSDTSVHSARSLAQATAFPVLATVPPIVTAKDLARKRRKKLLAVFAVAAFVVGGLTAFHLKVMDLNVFWAKLMRHLAI